VVLSGQRTLVLVRPARNHVLVAHVLHFPERLRSSASFETHARPEVVAEEERQLAGVLIDAASQPLVWSDYRDDGAERLQALLEAKRQQRALAGPTPQEDRPIPHLLEALKRSVAQAQRQEPSAPAAPSAAAAKPRKPSRKSASRKRASRRSA